MEGRGGLHDPEVFVWIVEFNEAAIMGDRTAMLLHRNMRGRTAEGCGPREAHAIMGGPFA